MDTLEIFGLEYSNVAGFKATNSSNNVLTYIRPTGTIPITTNGLVDVSAYSAANVNVSGFSADDIASGTGITGAISLTGSSVRAYAFQYSGVTNVVAPSVTSIGNYAFANCGYLGTVHLPLWTGSSTSNNYIFGRSGISGHNAIIVLPAVTAVGSRMFTRSWFAAVDLGPGCGDFGADTFYPDTESAQRCEVLILRKTSGVVGASTVDAIKMLRDVYVPDDLITTYQGATNWSTRYSAGYITFHAIEDSQYENYYADGTPISS